MSERLGKKNGRKAAEKLITRAKVDSVHNRREAAKFIQDEIILAKLFTNIGLRMKDRNGGYTRMLKLGFRQGDAADIVILELVDYQLDSDKKSSKKDDKKKADSKKSTSKKAGEKKSTAKKVETLDAKVEKKTKKSNFVVFIGFISLSECKYNSFFLLCNSFCLTISYTTIKQSYIY